MGTRAAMKTKDVESVCGSKAFLNAMDPTTTLFTFMLRTDPSVNTVRLLGSWDSFSMAYAMERDSRRERGQWRGCHTFSNIICDGDTPANHVPRSGGLKMGQTYYYYYEVNGTTETHDPAIPSTTACPYLPGQRVNTLWVPIEQSSRQRSASVNSLRPHNFKTMNPADKFVTPRPPPATPSVVGPSPPPPPPASAMAMAIPYERRPVSPLPTPGHLLRHQRSVRSLSPSPSLSTWSPRRLFARRASPSREVKSVDDHHQDYEESNTFVPSSVASENDTYLHRPVLSSRLVSSSSASSISSISRSRHTGLAPATYFPSSASQGSRSRDISPESLRRFLVDDAPLGNISSDNITLTGHSVSSTAPAVAVDTNVVGHNSSFFLAEMDDEDDDDEFDALNISKNNNKGHDLDFIDDDEHNFATSTTSDTAPMTILSPPPPASRNITPLMVPVEDKVDVNVEAEENTPTELPLPDAPTRAPPAIPEPAPKVEEADAKAEVEESAATKLDLPQLNLNLDLPPVLAPPSPMSLSPMSMSSMSGALSFQSHEDDSEPLETDAGCSSAALFLPPPKHPFLGASEGTKADPESQQHRQYRHHLMDAALTGSTTTLVPGNGLIGAGTASGLDDLVDELGWMATAIQD